MRGALLVILATLGCTPPADTGPTAPEDTEADADTDADTDTAPEPQESWETAGDCPDLEEVQALPEAGGEVLFLGDWDLALVMPRAPVYVATFDDDATWEAFVADAGMAWAFPEPVDFTGAQVLLGAAWDGTTCSDGTLEIHDVVIADGTRHLDVTLHGWAGDDCDLSACGSAFLRVPAGPATVCARRHEEVR